MVGSKQGIILAIVWLFLTAANQPIQQAETNTAQGHSLAKTSSTDATVNVSVSPYKAYPDPFADACYNVNDHEAADLCAQWRSMLSSEKSAKEAQRATNWAIVAAFLSAASFIGLIWTIWQTYSSLGEARSGNRLAMKANARATRQSLASSKDTARAIDVAERNAAAVTEQVRISAEVAKRELRAYVTAVSARVDVWIEDHVTNIKLEIVLHNSGKTTAIIDLKKARFQSLDWKCNSQSNDKTIISPSGHETVTIQCGTGGEIPSLNIVARMFVEYRDYLGDVHTEDSFWFCGPAFPVPATRTSYNLVCHSKIDETIGRFIDPSGEEEERKEMEEIIGQARRRQLESNT